MSRPAKVDSDPTASSQNRRFVRGRSNRQPRSAQAADLRLDRLLARTASGDRDSFAAVYDATAARAHGLAARILGDWAASQDVIQDAYLEIWVTSARYDAARGSAISWILTIVHHRAVDRVRSLEAGRARDLRYLDERRLTTPLAHELDMGLTTVEALAVRRALTTLSAYQRQALMLAYFGGYTHTEIARLLDIPLGTAKSRIRDGLIRLRETMTSERSGTTAAPRTLTT